MTIEAFEPISLGVTNQGVLVGAPDKVTAVTDGVDTSYVWVDTPAARKRQNYFVSNPGDRAVSIDADPDIDVRAQHDIPDAMGFEGEAHPAFTFDDVVRTRGVASGDLNNITWLNSNSGPVLRPGGGTWVPIDFNTVQLSLLAKLLGNTGVQVRYSKISYNLNFSLTPGAFLVLMSCWIPPLMAVASHGLMHRDITRFFRCFKSRPSNRQEYEAIHRELLIRPVYG